MSPGVPFDFPDSPTVDQEVTAVGGIVYVWDGIKWISGAAPMVYLPLAGGTMTGDIHMNGHNLTGVNQINGSPVVMSVFGRTGAVVAQSGDYTAAQVTNAVSTLGSYADPPWITSLAWSKVTGAPAFITGPAGTNGQVQFNGGAGAFGASADLFWDNTNGRLGIGMTSPTVSLEVQNPAGAATAGIILRANANPASYTEIRCYNDMGDWCALGINSSAVAAPFTPRVGYIATSSATDMVLRVGTIALHMGSNVPTPSLGEVMRLATTGIGIRTSTPASQLSFGNIGDTFDLLTYPMSDQAGMNFYTITAWGADRILDIAAGAPGGPGHMRFLTTPTGQAAATVMFLAATGNVGIGTGNTGGAYRLTLGQDSAGKPATNTWTIISDIRTKREISRFDGDIEVIRRLNPIVAEYNGRARTPEGTRVVSFDPEELREICPQAVSSVRTKLNPEDTEETDVLGVNTHELFFHLIRAVQQIDARLSHLEPS